MGRIQEPRAPSELPDGGYVGVDPGKDGTIGYVFGDAGEGEFWRFDRMTDQEIWDVFEVLGLTAKAAALEKVSSHPKDGKVQAFKFGHGAGKVEGWLVAAHFRWDFVTPVKWQGDLKCRTRGDKKVTQSKAQQMWPHLKFTQKNAEGLLIAEWCRCFAPWGR